MRSLIQRFDSSAESQSPEEKEHLSAWKLAIKKIGKGTGKYAPQYRREAREHLEHCRPAIPAWVMPVYRVAETIQPRPGMFDVVIIDEASQSGPEALFLLYIAKKIVVVGDDQQISPEDVGIDYSVSHRFNLAPISGRGCSGS